MLRSDLPREGIVGNSAQKIKTTLVLLHIFGKKGAGKLEYAKILFGIE